MSKLFYTETGRTIHCANEELTERRHARKLLKLPKEIASGATLYFLAAAHPDCAIPLRVAVNGHPFEVAPDGKAWVHWFKLTLTRELLKPGDNTIDFWCDAWAQDSWMLGLESGHPKPRSFLSFDGGKTWQNRHMGVLIRMPGEYVVRLRLEDPKRRDPAPPDFIWEDRNSGHFEKIRGLIPAQVRGIADPWEKARALVSWTIVQWKYRNVLTGGVDYAPWDLPTIVSWGAKSYGHWHKDPVVMCVHYAIVTTTAALALGIPARNVCSTNGLGGTGGHFMSEVWMERWQKWCVVDPTFDLVFVKDGVPLGIGELYEHRSEVPEIGLRGTGYPTLPQELKTFLDAFVPPCMEGTKYWAVWPRNDYQSHPEMNPPGHGSTSYAETEWQWRRPSDGEDLGMFPQLVKAKALMAPPPPPWR